VPRLPEKWPLTWDNGIVIIPSQVSVPAGSAVPLGLVPPGAQAAVSSYAGTIYIGAGTGVTTSTGMPVSGYALLPPNGPTGAPTQLYAIAGSGTIGAGFLTATPR
jgi:hypothetical protein